MQTKDEDKKDNEQEEFENQRSEKLLNSKDNNRKLVICEFCIFALLFISYFLVDYSLQSSFINNIKKSYDHLSLISQRSSLLKYSVVFTLEYMIDPAFVGTGEDSLKERYINLVYQNERDIFSSYKESYPSQYTKYKDTFKNYNYDDMCANYNSADQQCKNIAQGILTKGLRTSIVSLVESNSYAPYCLTPSSCLQSAHLQPGAPL